VYVPKDSALKKDFVVGGEVFTAERIVWINRLTAKDDKVRAYSPEMVVLMSHEEFIVGVRTEQDWSFSKFAKGQQWELLLPSDQNTLPVVSGEER
jgi:hypothetical protein